MYTSNYSYVQSGISLNTALISDMTDEEKTNSEIEGKDDKSVESNNMSISEMLSHFLPRCTSKYPLGKQSCVYI